jgi:glycogen debranching enzyme
MYAIIKNDHLFLYLDEKGNILDKHGQGWGLYRDDIRFLSRMEWRLDDSGLESIACETAGAESIHRFKSEEGEALEVECRRWLDEGVLFERWTVQNHASEPLEPMLSVRLSADFAHRLIIREQQEGMTDKGPEVETTATGLRFSSRGTDGVERALQIQMSPTPASVTNEGASFHLPLVPHGEQQVTLCYIPMVEETTPTVPDETEALAHVRRSHQEWLDTCPRLESDDADLTAFYQRGLRDLHMLLTESGEGKLPWAGLPWNGMIHGRDSLIAAWQSLVIQPDIAEAVLRLLARHQGRSVDDARGEEPGKIMGELQAHTRDYFSVETTPLFLILLAKWHQWSGDDDFVREMLPHVRKAMDWMDRQVKEGSGILYAPAHHGWRNTLDLFGGEEGQREAVAWVEVQGYGIWAKQCWSRLFHYLGNIDDARSLAQEAKAWRKHLIQNFWDEKSGVFATVRSREGVIPVVTGAPGHLLQTGVLDSTQAEAVAKRLLQPDLFNGWGIRTLSAEAADYRPFSRHRGAVWPHETAWITAGLITMGLHAAADILFRGLLDAAGAMENHRLPERFAGHSRNQNRPTPTPGACPLQAVSAGCVFSLLEAVTGLRPDVPRRIIRLSPYLPDGIGYLSLQGIRIGQGRLDLHLRRWGKETYLRVAANTTGCRVVID